jgi:hypothetical protein
MMHFALNGINFVSQFDKAAGLWDESSSPANTVVVKLEVCNTKFKYQSHKFYLKRRMLQIRSRWKFCDIYFYFLVSL